MPEFQHKGIGSKLIHYSMEKAKVLGYAAIAITGNPQLYNRYRFRSGAEHSLYSICGGRPSHPLTKKGSSGNLL
ncbi:MAG: hypothetical protein JEY71_06165 [Sphaerochaeta sp.]|nr:hypothetical protein [Sphaerochaeta sp.]